ncbi:uncharacterized protein CLV78_101346 [Aliiruegeria haliotis]|uniref:Mth938-like domain-containing protein n=1 Tax=Aliiruegeria haliotis TaxID=1280846 RepID=A0A2T0RYJ3_9RHOB|nr:Mth938-like domain-containing protein [Aliiruegeria haliotis]PRY26251.1 uncharacterized protein CLV78_101346 [Aliiruegeria haliotis]
MRVNEVVFDGSLPFEGYGPGFFTLGGERHDGSLIVSGDGVQPWAGYVDPAPILALVDKIDFILLGTGAEIAHPPTAFRTALEEAGIGIEPMATPSACRTYNVLLSEGRRVAAVVLALPAEDAAAGA